MWKAQKSEFSVALSKFDDHEWNEPGEKPWSGVWGLVAPGMTPGIQAFLTSPCSPSRFSGWAENVAEHTREYSGWKRELDVDYCVDIAPSEASRSVWAGSYPLCPQFGAHHELFWVPAIGNTISLQPIAKASWGKGQGKALGCRCLVATAHCPAEKSLFSAITQPSHQPFPGATAGWKGQGHVDITREVLSAMHHASLLLYGVREAEIWALFLPGKALFFPFLHIQ